MVVGNIIARYLIENKIFIIVATDAGIVKQVEECKLTDFAKLK
jgi:hypothetical protein